MKENIDLIREVGAFSYKALLHAKSFVKPGARLLDVAELAEEFVKKSGFACAFPINLSINEQAAHYSPGYLDEKVFSANDVVKIDFGAAKNGTLGDCAVTVDLSGKHQNLVNATETALHNAIGTVKPGVTVRDIGREIEKTILELGFVPIRNLGGHGVAEHDLHSHPFVPNHDNGDSTALEDGDVIAIEPFATSDGKGIVSESDVCEIYEFARDGRTRSQHSRLVMEEIIKNYPSEPFAVRWLSGVVKDRFSLYAAISELARSGIIVQHPVLISSGRGMVSQAEAQVLVTKDGCEVLTK